MGQTGTYFQGNIPFYRQGIEFTDQIFPDPVGRQVFQLQSNEEPDYTAELLIDFSEYFIVEYLVLDDRADKWLVIDMGRGNPGSRVDRCLVGIDRST